MTRRTMVVGFTVLIALASWSISFASQVGVAGEHKFGWWEAAGWPACTEAGALAVMLLLVAGQVRRGAPTALAWGIVAVCLIATTWINWLAAPGDLVGAVMHSWTPVLSVAVMFLLVHGRPGPTAAKPARTLKEAAPETRPVARARHASSPVANHSNGHAPAVVAQATGEACQICGQNPCPERKKHLATLRKRRQRAQMQGVTV